MAEDPSPTCPAASHNNDARRCSSSADWGRMSGLSDCGGEPAGAPALPSGPGAEMVQSALSDRRQHCVGRHEAACGTSCACNTHESNHGHHTCRNAAVQKLSAPSAEVPTTPQACAHLWHFAQNRAHLGRPKYQGFHFKIHHKATSYTHPHWLGGNQHSTPLKSCDTIFATRPYPSSEP